jgi:hypothetical protein
MSIENSDTEVSNPVTITPLMKLKSFLIQWKNVLIGITITVLVYWYFIGFSSAPQYQHITLIVPAATPSPIAVSAPAVDLSMSSDLNTLMTNFLST